MSHDWIFWVFVGIVALIVLFYALAIPWMAGHVLTQAEIDAATRAVLCAPTE